jgi:hypothetical protein
MASLIFHKQLPVFVLLAVTDDDITIRSIIRFIFVKSVSWFWVCKNKDRLESIIFCNCNVRLFIMEDNPTITEPSTSTTEGVCVPRENNKPAMILRVVSLLVK